MQNRHPGYGFPYGVVITVMSIGFVIWGIVALLTMRSISPSQIAVKALRDFSSSMRLI